MGFEPISTHLLRTLPKSVFIPDYANLVNLLKRNFIIINYHFVGANEKVFCIVLKELHPI